MRARIFRDDLERVVDEIENSAIMWLGISKGAHGYDAIDTDDQVTVRSEVARLTRLYDKAVKTNTLNDPDTYDTGGPGDPHSAALRDRSAQATAVPVAVAPPPAPGPAADPNQTATIAPPQTTLPDPDASPATKPPEPPKAQEAEIPAENSSRSPKVPPASAISSASQDSGNEDVDSARQGNKPAATTESSKPEQSNSANASNPTAQPATTAASPALDPDESPASAAHPQKHSEDTSKAEGETR